MFDPIANLRKWRDKIGMPSTEDIEIQSLYMDMKKFEAQTFCDYIFKHFQNHIENAPEHLREDPVVPPDTLESWVRLDDDTKMYVFMYLLGAVYGLMRPPDDHVGAYVGH